MGNETKPKQVLILEPASEIHFVGPFTETVSSCFSLTNPIDQPVCFKIRTTAPKRCCVRPNYGILNPKGKVTVEIALQPNFNPDEKIKLKFMIQSMILSEIISKDINILFQEAKPEDIMNSMLMCVFHMPDELTHNILIIGSGGSEHALAWKLSESPRVKQIFVAPGNAGTHLDTSGKIANVAMNIKNNNEIVEWCNVLKVGLVVGDKDSLSNGIADCLNEKNIKYFGPCRRAARIENNKEFFNFFMDCYNVPTADRKSITNAEDSENHILRASDDALVVKTSGLSTGEGVVVASSKEDDVKAVHSLKEVKDLPSASETFVNEESLEGKKVSVLCFSDGVNISVMPPTLYHKFLFDSDESAITNVMGKCLFSDNTLELIQKNILQKVIDGMKFGGDPYIGVLYASLMMTKDGPKVLELKCWFGDPETQVILPLLNSDLYEIMLACLNGTLDKMDIQWSSTKLAVGVEVVSEGYPDNYSKGKVITGLDKLSSDCIVFHSGTVMNDNSIITSSGRVLTVVAVEGIPGYAASIAKKCASEINFHGAFCCNLICSQRF